MQHRPCCGRFEPPGLRYILTNVRLSGSKAWVRKSSKAHPRGSWPNGANHLTDLVVHNASMTGREMIAHQSNSIAQSSDPGITRALDVEVVCVHGCQRQSGCSSRDLACLTISPMRPRSARPSTAPYLGGMLRSVDVASVSISAPHERQLWPAKGFASRASGLHTGGDVLADLEHFSLAMAPMMVNIARPMGICGVDPGPGG